MEQKFCLCNRGRIVYGPATYDRTLLGAVLKHHGGSIEDLPSQVPLQAAGVLYLRLLPVIDIGEAPEKIEFYHRSQPNLTVDVDQVNREYSYTLFHLGYCAEIVIARIAKESDKALALLETGYTEHEIKSWPQQRAEAAEYTLDNMEAVPLLQGMASRRGIPLATFVAHVQAKVKETADLTAIILGDAQAANDNLKALNILNETGNLPSDWFDQLMNIADDWRKDWPALLLQA
jgi:hypothetical protein